ncbi:tRNA pseudouridine(38-40) synthase TruA [Hufsiella ginkgonis]|uniref:tRNA pseudouridine synthase A n=1 Tax=Hufsiella ginkgonis TaxID=2695274 RepID=A0A7K1XY02_9SPHI|nr:tRNA pseudouridine(38-40) synthase TruA [Hufsiella ginkgonis]
MNRPSRYFLEIAYDGSKYHGWQVQPNAATVQEVLEKALSIYFRQPIATVGCGRTDTGVHAKQFYLHFDLEGRDELSAISHQQSAISGQPSAISHQSTAISSQLSAMSQQQSAISHQHVTNGINALLPFEIAVKRMIAVNEGAHARFDATLRSYEYHVHFMKDPFKHGFSWLLRDVPDVAAMNQAAVQLADFRDFSCFSKSNTQVFTNNCTVSKAEWLWRDDSLVFYISADRFLRNMVRAVVGTLMEIGRGKISPLAIRGIIESKNRSNAGASVPACGLYLTAVEYPYITHVNN